MGKLFTLVLAFFASLLVGGIVQNLLAVYAKADLEFVIAIVIFILATQIYSIVFGIALFAHWSIDRCALWLTGITVALVIAGEIVIIIAQGSIRTVKADTLILGYMIVPSLIAIAIHWLIVRRRAARDRALV
ncbi:hypothetical protein GJW-30_1_02983 [Variibacter gotjawalensis]|uniref:Uncharacterized protein n=1 Tax=Variibacter gotjawalensis TaxID=1333996 RepID=A0A0S3PWX4_9BRAD|nr:hypothetical protein [Variibacter gotjawalensis]NIK46268.1 hypothetical protein [Variibacter gotjawalensis]RZS48183.1 hypothetical protein EV661_0586 [Variibacter gotjawalensis]BAT60440.1 hypothetical protein GJW-30_1_02983 [Variibacter gotjawalensis]